MFVSCLENTGCEAHFKYFFKKSFFKDLWAVSQPTKVLMGLLTMKKMLKMVTSNLQLCTF